MIDWSRAQSLRDEIGEEAFDEVLGLFLAEAVEGLDRMAATPDAGALEAALHFLKGSALNLGFEVLARLCAEGERAAAAGAPVDRARIAAVFAQSRAAFLEGLAAGLHGAGRRPTD